MQVLQGTVLMEMSFLLFIGFASRAKQGHPEQKENSGVKEILKFVNQNCLDSL